MNASRDHRASPPSNLPPWRGEAFPPSPLMGEGRGEGEAAGTLPLPLTGGGHGRGWYRLPLARAMESRMGESRQEETRRRG